MEYVVSINHDGHYSFSSLYIADNVSVSSSSTECDVNLKPDGTCAEGALEPDCCSKCNTTGNDTQA